MRQATTVQIDDRTYTIGHWAPDHATEVLAWLTATFAPIMSQLFSEATADVEDDKQLIARVLEKGAPQLPKLLEPRKYSEMVRSMTKDLLVDGAPCNYNFHFQGRIFHLHKVIIAILKHQYSDFFDGAQGLLGV
jgi:hypothetical protein